MKLLKKSHSLTTFLKTAKKLPRVPPGDHKKNPQRNRFFKKVSKNDD